MSKPYYSILTNIGENLVAKATALGTKLDLTTMAVGDGNGKLPAPDPAQTKLINEKRRAAVNSLEIDKNNPNIIIVEHIIPETEGGWWVREIGLFDSEGNLIAVGNCPETYKPKMIEGSGRTQIIRMMIVVKSTDCIELKSDPSVVLATRDYVDTKILDADKKNESLRAELKAHEGAYLVGGVMPIWRVGDHGGDYGAGKDISKAFNLTAQAKGSQFGTILLPHVEGVLFASDSLVIPKNTYVDLQGNELKLANNTNKYLMRNDDEYNLRGSISIFNGIIDANKAGNGVRRYDKSKQNASGLKYFDYRDNYPGFTLMFSHVDKLSIKDLHVKNSDGWSISHFNCNHVEGVNLSFAAPYGSGSNADGITGIGAKFVKFTNISGFTNDDMVAVSTSRATLQGVPIYNPEEGRDLELFEVNGLYPESLNDVPTHVGIGVYLSDSHIIKSVILNKVAGVYNNYVARMGNYWPEAPSGILQKFVVNNLTGTVLKNDAPDFHFFKCAAYHAAFNNTTTTKNKEVKNSPLVNVYDGFISVLTLNNAYYFNLQSDLVNSIVTTQESGSIRSLILNTTLDYPASRANNTLFLKKDSGDTKLYIVNAQIGSPSMNIDGSKASAMSMGHIFNNMSSGKISTYNFNTTVSNHINPINGFTNGDRGVVVFRCGNAISISGAVIAPKGAKDGTVMFELPEWAMGYSFGSVHTAALEQDKGFIRLVREGREIKYYNSNQEYSGSVYLDEIRWDASPLLSGL
ncbi:phage tail protein [Providencia hangzhouensis]|uniref:phage tail-collar fiber domain-containing protein n=1 Tax=Providencia hangzhouensis TaxID=3031799 RepID=UPI0034DD7176